MKVVNENIRRMVRTTAFAIAAAAVAVLPSCTKETEESYSEIEKRSFNAWMRNHHPELLENYQEDGGYYVEVLDAGVADSTALADLLTETGDDDETNPGCWVSFNVTGRDLSGQVCLTRDEMTARMQNTFTKFTHYVPYVRFLGAENTSLPEGSYLAMKNTLKIGDETLQMRYGTALRLYMPSSLIGGTGLTGDGGYQGEYSLDSQRPVILEIKVTDRINNPVSYEAYMVDGFGIAHGGLSPVKEVAEDDEDADSDEESSEEGDGEEEEEEEEDDGLLWRHACDTIQGLIVSKRYSPDSPDWKFNYNYTFELDPETDEEDNPITGTGKKVANRVYADTDIYADINSLEDKINAALIERFGEGTFDGEKVGTEGAARIWYITRFLDGFIIDTNIEEVREIVFGADEASGTVISYTPESDKDSYVTAWYYTVPELRYGQWATIVTTSTFAYGVSGRSGSTTTSSSGGATYYYNPYYNYYNYYNSYYGSSYYDMYYYNMYNNYYYNDYYNSSSTTETTTSTSTEIQPYTPLIFQLYIEEK